MPTIYDVAKTAGVSPKTVSRVLNGSELVRESTRLAVSKAMEELDYVPSSAARTLRSNRSGLVGLVTNALAGVFDRPDQAGLPDLVLVQAIQQRLESTGLTLLIADSGGNQERVATLLRTFAEHRVEGAFYVAQFHQKVSLPTTTGLPHVVVVNGFDSTQSPSVSPNDYAGQHALVERLIAAGHRRIAYLTLPTPLIATRERSRGWREAIQEAGLAPDAQLLREGISAEPSRPETPALLSAAVDCWLSLDDPPSVICTGNDRMAMRLLTLLRSRGLEVPRDISVAGYDDHRLISEMLEPALTTVELPYRRMGEAAADLLVALINDEAPEKPHTSITGDVHWRESVQSIQL